VSKNVKRLPFKTKGDIWVWVSILKIRFTIVEDLFMISERQPTHRIEKAFMKQNQG
jgi:hypothetical protein